MMLHSLSFHEKSKVSEIKVCQNGRGKYYIGRLYIDEQGIEYPYDRISREYYNTKEEAEMALKYKDFTPRYYDFDEVTRNLVLEFMCG